MKTRTLSKAEWKAVEAELSSPYCFGVVMTADGHRLRLTVEKVKKLRYAIVVYVDGWFRGEWAKGDSEIGAKFWRPRRVSLFSAHEFKKIEKAHGKRFADGMRKKYTGSIWHDPAWTSVGSFRRHIAKTCRDVQLVSVGYQPERTAQEASA